MSKQPSVACLTLTREDMETTAQASSRRFLAAAGGGDQEALTGFHNHYPASN
jgi:hypothetical protein